MLEVVLYMLGKMKQPLNKVLDQCELVVKELDHVEMVEHVDRFLEVVPISPDVSLGHVGGHGLNLDPRPPQPRPERLQGLGPLPVADEHHGHCEQVEHHSGLMMPFAAGDLVDGNLHEIAQFGLAKAVLFGDRRGLTCFRSMGPVRIKVNSSRWNKARQKGNSVYGRSSVISRTPARNSFICCLSAT